MTTSATFTTGASGASNRWADDEGLDVDGVPVRAICRFDDRRLPFTDDDLMKVDLCYGMTTHKAQGSQWKRVVVSIVDSRILDRTLVYTALTRGQDQVVFIGDRTAFARAIENPPTALTRRVGFNLDDISEPAGEPTEEGATSMPLTTPDPTAKSAGSGQPSQVVKAPGL